MPVVKLGEEEKKNADDFFRMANEYRQTNGKNPLQLVDLICSLAKEHNDLMVSGKLKLSHDVFSDRARRIKNSKSNAESVYCCSDQDDVLKVFNPNFFINTIKDILYLLFFSFNLDINF